MPIFRPGFEFWPRPQFLGRSSQGLAAWLECRDPAADPKPEELRSKIIKRIVDNHHDRNARTIFPSR